MVRTIYSDLKLTLNCVCSKKKGGLYMKKWSLIFLLAVCLTATVVSRSRAIPDYLNLFNTTYGTTGTRLDQCILCHTTNNPNANPTLNPFGSDFGGTTVPGHTVHVFDTALENWDSDGDGFTNIVEIHALTFPGDPADHPIVLLPITVTAPTAGEVIPSGSTFTITYTAPAAVTSVRVKYSLDGGLTWVNANGTPGAGSFAWTVPKPVQNTAKALVKVIGFNASNAKIAAGKSPLFKIDVVSITAPISQEIVPKGSLYDVTWLITGTTKSPVNSAKVFYTFGSSGIWKPASGTVTNPLISFSWNVPSPAKSKITKLKVILKDASGVKVGVAISKAFIVQ